MDTPPSDNLYMTQLPSGISEGMLCEVFSQLGKVVQCKVLPNPVAGGAGAALVRFASVEEAQLIVMQMNGVTPPGFDQPISVKFAQQRARGGGGGGGSYGGGDASSPYGGGGPFGAEAPSDNLYIKGLPAGVDEAWLQEALGGLATVVSVKVLQNPSPELGGGGAALARFQTADDATHVKNLLHGQSPDWCAGSLIVRYAAQRGGARGGGSSYTPGMAGGFSAAAQAGSAVEQLLHGEAINVDADFLVKMVNEAVVLPGAGTRFHNNEATIYVGGLPVDTTENHVYQLFSPLGAIFSVFVKRGGAGTNVWAIAFINYVDPLSAQAAIAVYNGMQVPDGSVLKVKIKDAKGGAGFGVSGGE